MIEPTELLKNAQYPMRVVVRRTGLNPSVLRAWERRYDAVEPGRSDGGQRLYSEADVQRLTLLKELVEAGHTISQIAELEVDALRALVRREAVSVDAEPDVRNGRDESPQQGGSSTGARQLGTSQAGMAGAASITPAGTLERALRAVHTLNGRELESVLSRAALALTPVEVVDEVVVPLLGQIGHQWQQGQLSPASEHAASQVIRRFLGWLLDALSLQGGTPLVVISTPAGQQHEFGSLLAAVSAVSEGWEVLNLGADLPAQDIAEAALRSGARAVALSAIFPPNDGRVLGELLDLRAELDPSIDIFVGGPAARPHAERLRPAGVEFVDDLPSLRRRLREVAEVMRGG